MPKVVAAVAVLAVAGPWMPQRTLVEYLAAHLRRRFPRWWAERSMLTFTEAQLLGWVTPILWAFLRVLALLGTLPVIGQRIVPMRLRVALAFLIALRAGQHAGVAPIPLDSAVTLLVVLQQIVIGVSLGFAVRIVFAAVEFAGELVGLQMGLNFAGFFDPATGGQATAVSRFFGVTVSWLFIVTGGHLLVIAGVVQSLHSFPVGPEPFAFLKASRSAGAPRSSPRGCGSRCRWWRCCCSSTW